MFSILYYTWVLHLTVNSHADFENSTLIIVLVFWIISTAAVNLGYNNALNILYTGLLRSFLFIKLKYSIHKKVMNEPESWASVCGIFC